MSTMNRFWMVMACLAGFFSAGCGEKTVVPVRLEYEVVSVKPHDTGAYTQGLQMKDGRLFESTGHYGQSTVREVDPETGKVLRRRPLTADLFGEGLTLHGGELWVLTWKEGKALVLEKETFKLSRTYQYEGEGWGLTSDGTDLIMSDGGTALKFVDAKDFSVKREVEVKDQGRSLRAINELEYVEGQVFANILLMDRIARIDVKSGQVTGWLDLSALRSRLPRPNRAEVLNGVAYDEKTGHLWVTGKNWPQMFEIRLVGE